MTDWLSILRQAATSQYGVVVAVSDANAAKQALYRAREGQPGLEGLQLRSSPDNPDKEIWIVKAKPNGS